MKKKFLFLLLAQLMFLTVFSQPVPQWVTVANGLISNDNIQPRNIVSDPVGNTYCTGQFGGTFDFDPSPGTYTLSTSSGATHEVFIYKLNPQGQFVWARQLVGGYTYNMGWDIALDGLGNLYVSGHFADTVDFDPGPAVFKMGSGPAGQPQEHAFLLKLDTAGNFGWAKQFGVHSTRPMAVACDGSGNVYTSGIFSNVGDFDPGPATFTLNPMQGGSFFSKFDGAGNLVWCDQLPGSSQDIVVKGSDVYVTGAFSGLADFDPGPGSYTLTSTSVSAYICKVNLSGTLQWAKSFNMSSGNSFGTSTDISLTGNVFVTGRFNGTIDLDPGPSPNLVASTNTVSSDAFLVKLSPSGNYTWGRTYGPIVNPFDISVDKFENTYTIGTFNGSGDFNPGPGSFILSGTDDIFINKIDSSGNLFWVGQIGGPNLDLGFSVALDSSANLYATGQYRMVADLDPGPGTYTVAATALDLFVQKITSGGPLSILQNQPTSSNIAPNPFQDKISICLQYNRNAHLSIFNSFGQKVYEEKLESVRTEINLDNLSPGVYILRISSSGRIYEAKKIIKD